MIYLIKNAQVYSPEALGRCDILIAGTGIAEIADDISLSGDAVQVIDAGGMLAVPGLVDSLVHFSGGGGEGGFHTRTPDMTLTDASLAGVTTVIGALGTDATTRSHADLLAKAHALDYEGISTYCYSGSYQIPAKTITGDLTRDLLLIDKCIGVGEIAIADHRSSQPDAPQLARLAAQARVGGMLSGKAGIVSIHVGDSETKLDLLHQVVEQSDIPAQQFYPTHMNRNASLLEAGVAWSKLGGRLDFTTSTNAQFIADGEIPAAEAVARCLRAGVNIAQLTMSSDGNASLPVFDEQGELIGLEVGKVASLLHSLQTLVQEYDVPMVKALSCVTSSPADILRLSRKGRLARGKDADILLLDPDTLAVRDVFGRGQRLVENATAVRFGTFEAPEPVR